MIQTLSHIVVLQQINVTEINMQQLYTINNNNT